MAGVAGRSGGRNAKTVAEHRIAGTFQPVRHGNHANPQVLRGRPEPPKPLDGDAMAEWIAICDELDAAGTLAKTDRMVLYQYCRMFAETEAQGERASEFAAGIQMLEDNLSDLKGVDLVACFQEIGKLHQLRASNETKVRQGRMSILRFLVEFGNTPAARSRVKLPVGSTADSDEAALDKLLAIQ